MGIGAWTDLRDARLIRGPVVTPDTDFTGKVRLRDLPGGSTIHYRVRAESLERPGLFGPSVSGSLSTAPLRRTDIRFVWTLDEWYRGFAAEVPQINQWDDHEVTNNWYPGEILEDSRYTEKRVDVLAARARQAFHEWIPTPGGSGPIYRTVPYGPLLDVFVLDMRTRKDPTTAMGTPTRSVACWAAGGQHVAGRRLPALRRGGDRRRVGRAHRAPTGPRGRRPLVGDLEAAVARVVMRMK
jgi:phosphodiesterase/alkaline phosphatase D-like protein